MAATELLSVSNLNADEASPKFYCQLGTSRGPTHTLEMSIGGSVVFTVTGIVVSSQNQGYIPITLTAENRAVVLAAMPNSASVTATYTLKTYSGSTLLGSSSKTAKVLTSEALSGPSFWGVTLADVNAVTEDLSPDALIQNASLLSAVFRDAVARNGATISKYTVTIGEKTVESATSTVAFGEIPLSGDVSIITSVEDSRGYKATITYTQNIIPYAPLTIRSFNARRVNNVESTISVSFSGSYSPLVVEGSDLNTITGAAYKYKQGSGSYGTLTPITGLTVGNGSFSYSNATFESLNNNSDYTLYVEVTDRISTAYVEIYIMKGIPLIRLTRGGVYINTVSGGAVVNISGVVEVNGHRIMATYLGELSTIDLNTLTKQGIYAKDGSAGTLANHYPVATQGIVEVLQTRSLVLQRFTDIDNLNVYLRKYDGSAWSAWKQI